MTPGPVGITPVITAVMPVPSVQAKTIVDAIAAAGGYLNARISFETWYLVYEDLDKEAGRGGVKLRYCVPTQADANELAKGLGYYGNPGRIEPVNYLAIETLGGQRFLVSADPPVRAAEVEKARVRASAIRKLTPAERDALRDDDD